MNRAARAYRYNVPALERVGFRAYVHDAVRLGNPDARAWALEWSRR